MYYEKFIWLLLIFVIRGVQPSENNTSSPVLFILAGQAALKTAYGHLVIPLNLPSIKRRFDHFEDLVKAINQLTTGTDQMYAHHNSEVRNLQREVEHFTPSGSAKDERYDVRTWSMNSMISKTNYFNLWGTRLANGNLKHQPLQRARPQHHLEEREILF